VDLFHVVQLAVKMTGDVRRAGGPGEVRPARPLRATPSTGSGPLVRNLEHLRPEQFAKVTDTLSRDRHGQEIAVAWIGKEKLP